MTSQPTRVRTRSSDWTTSSMAARNRDTVAAKTPVAGVVAQVPDGRTPGRRARRPRRRRRRPPTVRSASEVQRDPQLAQRAAAGASVTTSTARGLGAGHRDHDGQQRRRQRRVQRRPPGRGAGQRPAEAGGGDERQHRRDGGQQDREPGARRPARSLMRAARSRSTCPGSRNSASTTARATPISAAAMVMTKRVEDVAGCAAGRASTAPSGDEQQVGGVEDELDADQDEHRVAPGEHAVDARRRPGPRRAARGRPRWITRPPSAAARRARASRDTGDRQAATSATSSSSDSSSNGHTQAPNSAVAMRLGAAVADLDGPAADERAPAPPPSSAVAPAADDRGRRAAAARWSTCAALRPDRRAGQHQGEQHEDDDRADVDQQLHQGHQLGPEHQVAAGERAERHDQPQGGVHELAGGHGEDGARGGDQRRPR